MTNLHAFSITFIIGLSFLLLCSIVSLFYFKQKVYTIKKEISMLDQIISHENKKSMLLGVDCTLEHTSTKIQKMADQVLSTRFTNVKQLMTIDDLATYNASLK